jgi:hypothetical protein
MAGMKNRSGHDTSDDSSVPQPKWTEEIDLQTIDAAGLVHHVTICLSDPSTALIALIDAHSRTEFSGTDYLDCLSQARRQLELDGRLLCCQGARLNVHPSGQLRQFTNGRQAYVRHWEPWSEGTETVDIFAPAPAGDVATLDDQRAAIVSSWNARHPGNQI